QNVREVEAKRERGQKRRHRIAGLEILDQAGVDEEAIEAPRLRAAGASVEQALAAFEYLLLLGERGIERESSGLLQNQGQVWRLDRLKRRGKIDAVEIDGVDRVVGREIGRVIGRDPARQRPRVERRIEDARGNGGLVVAEADDEEGVVGVLPAQAIAEGD